MVKSPDLGRGIGSCRTSARRANVMLRRPRLRIPARMGSSVGICTQLTNESGADPPKQIGGVRRAVNVQPGRQKFEDGVPVAARSPCSQHSVDGADREARVANAGGIGDVRFPAFRSANELGPREG